MAITPIVNIGVHSAATHEQYVTPMKAAPSGNRGMKTMGAMIAMMKVGKRYMEVKTMTVEERARITLEKFQYSSRIKDGLKAIEEALRDQIEDCAKKTDDESLRIDSLRDEYYSKGEFDTVSRFSACVVTAAKLGRDIRALAAPTEEKKESER